MLGHHNTYKCRGVAFDSRLRRQAAEAVTFSARGPGYQLFLNPQEVVLVLRPGQPPASSDTPSTVAAPDQADTILGGEPAQAPPGPSLRDCGHRSHLQQTPCAAPPPVAPPSVIRMRLMGAQHNPQPRVEGIEPLPGNSNYFLGNDPAKWRTQVPHYAKVRYHEVYPGIDLVYYGNPRQLEYDFIVTPGADPSVIQLAFEGAEHVRVDAQGNLVLSVAGGEVVQHAPRIYQVMDGEERPIVGHYILHPQEQGQIAFTPDADSGQARVGFVLSDYRPDIPLVIDPTLVYGTYLGGNNSDSSYDLAVDSTGSIYVTGRTHSLDFPQVNAKYPSLWGEYDAFIFKLSSNGQTVIYSTYLGGKGEEVGEGIAVDGSGIAYITGRTSSADFPVVNAKYPQLWGMGDAFVFKLASGGNSVGFSTYLGGSEDEYGGGIALDQAANILVSGGTSSTDFPIVNAIYPNLWGDADAFIFKLSNNGQTVKYSTYLGGSSYEFASNIAVDGTNNVYVTGYTYSQDFPKVNAKYPNLWGATDAYLFKLSEDGQTVRYSTYLGGSGNEYGTGIAVDGSGNAYVTGWTTSSDFPRVNAKYPQLWGSFDAFVFKLSSNGQNVAFSTYLGGSSTDEGGDIAVDPSGNIYVTGSTSSTDFPSVNALYPNLWGPVDAFVVKLNNSGQTIHFSTYLGGSNGENGHALAVDGIGNAYIAGETSSSDFPVRNPTYPNLWGVVDGFIVKLGPSPETARLAFDTIGSNQTDGQSFSLTIRALDANNNLMNLNGPVQLSSSGLTVNPISVPMKNGIWEGTGTIYGAGSNIALTAYGVGLTGKSNSFKVSGQYADYAFLSGVVEDFMNSPMGAIFVHLVPMEEENETLITHETITDNAGRYLIGPVAAGKYTLWADASQQAVKSIPIQIELSSYGIQTKNIQVSTCLKPPVIFLPGILGSNMATRSGIIPRLPKHYPAPDNNLKLHDPWGAVGWEKLEKELKDDFCIYKVPYDWRGPIDQIATHYLVPAIDKARRETLHDQVSIVAHSTGGLVARQYIQNIQSSDNGGKVAKLAMVGTPHLGAVNAYYIWSGADPKRADDLNRWGPGPLGNPYWNSVQVLYEETYDLGDLSPDDNQIIYDFLRSKQYGVNQVGAELHNLLPTFPFLYYKDGVPWGLTSNDNKNTRLLELNADPYRYVRMTKSGNNETVRTAVFYSLSEDTIHRHETSNPIVFYLNEPRYADGFPTHVEPDKARGDGTVPDFSATLPCDEGWAKCYPIESSHMALIGEARTDIKKFLATDESTSLSPTPYAVTTEVQSAEFAINVHGRVRPYLIAPDGQTSGVNPATGLLDTAMSTAQVELDAQDGVIVITDPVAGTYEIAISGSAEEDIKVGLSFLSEAGPYSEDLRLFHAGGTSTFRVALDPSAQPPITVLHHPLPPSGLEVRASFNNGWKTTLAWQPSPTPGVSGYRLYSRSHEEPFMALVGTTTDLSFLTLLPWAGEEDAPVRMFAVSAVLPDGAESFLSEVVKNNDLDQDGLTDDDELQMGTDPTLKDTDGDGWPDGLELQRGTSPVLADSDGDLIFDTGDNCPLDNNPEQGDFDGDGLGDACDRQYQACQPEPLLISGLTFGPGLHTVAATASLATHGKVLVQPGAEVTFRAGRMSFGPGFKVRPGSQFRARAETVPCHTP